MATDEMTEVIKTIDIIDHQGHFDPRRRFQTTLADSNSQYDLIASYNWLQSASGARHQQPLNSPTLVIPGAPRRFVMWNGGKLEADTERVVADENRFFMKDYPLEPLFRTVLYEGYDPMAFHTLDLVTDRDNLRRLYDVCKFRPNQRTRPPRPFKINIERIGNRLVVLEQCSPIEYEQRSTPIFGTAFENQCTKAWSTLTTGSYHSIVKYNFGDICCLVRFTADCAEDWGKTDVVEEPIKLRSFDASRLRYIVHGYRKYDFNYVELTTRHKNSRSPDYIWDQLYFGRAKAAYIGWHTEGMCDYPQYIKMEDLTKDGHMSYPATPKLALEAERQLINRLLKFIRDRPAGERYVLSYDGDVSIDTIRLSKKNDTASSAPDSGILPVSLRDILENGNE